MDAADRESVPGKNPAVSGGKSIEEKKSKREELGAGKMKTGLEDYFIIKDQKKCALGIPQEAAVRQQRQKASGQYAV